MHGARYCVALNSCTTALQLALRVLDLPAGTEVVASPLTFVSANQAILQESLDKAIKPREEFLSRP
jgi:dTDP-4-amino-4,6-dideoxygalactose transaminase